jgi:hypothetical protein
VADNGFAGAAGQPAPTAFPKGFPKGFANGFLKGAIERFLEAFAQVALPNHGCAASRRQSIAQPSLDLAVKRLERNLAGGAKPVSSSTAA